MSLTLENVTANLSGKVRREKLHGRNYLVAPLSMIVPGVLNGSDGPILYTAEEGAKYPEVWNNMPIVVNHPKDKDGSHVSARDPDILNTHGIGYVFRSKHDNKLQSEGWFDEELTQKIEPRVYTALERNQAMEVSTGLFSDKEAAPPNATYNGLAYTKVAKNYRPDHLAVLPDTIGACSVRDGCGLNVNEDSKSLVSRIVEALLGIAGKPNATVPDKSTTNEGQQPLIANQEGDTKMLNEQQKKQIVDGLITNCGCQGKPVWTENEREYLSKLPDERLIVLDESRKRVAANEALIANVTKGVKVGDATITLNAIGELVAVKAPEAPTFKDAQGRVFVFNEATQSYVLQGNAGQQTQQQPQPAFPNRQLTDEEWKRLAPPRQQQISANYERWEAEQKAALIANIQANPSNVFPVEQLQAMEMQMLRNLAAMAGPAQQTYSTVNFGGAAVPFSANAGKGGSSSFDVNEDADMAPPEIDWKAAKSA